MYKVVEVRNVVRKFGDVIALNDISFEVMQRQCVALLGPSGCGKTTTLRIIAGFEKVGAGHVFINGENMIGKRPYERNIGLVFQDYALFPHMSVEQNIVYGMRHRKVSRQEIPKRLKEVLATVNLRGFESRRPSQLSGGEQQRVALARALATRPEIMLLDEPLSNLDAKLREQVRIEIKEILSAAGTTTIIVTHDQQEAMSLAEHVIVMNEGRVMQRATPAEIYARPNSKFVAEFIGRTNWFSGRIHEEMVPGVWAYESTEGLRLFVASREVKQGKFCEVGVRPERMTVDPVANAGARPHESYSNVVPGVVSSVSHLGADIHVWITLATGRQILVMEKNVGQSLDREGLRVSVRFDATSCMVLSKDEMANANTFERPPFAAPDVSSGSQG